MQAWTARLLTALAAAGVLALAAGAWHVVNGEARAGSGEGSGTNAGASPAVAPVPLDPESQRTRLATQGHGESSSQPRPGRTGTAAGTSPSPGTRRRRRTPVYLQQPLGSISFEVYDSTNNRRVSNFDYVVEVVGSPPTRGSSVGNHRAAAPAPVDMPFNLRVEAKGYQPAWLRQVRLRRGQPSPCHTILVRPATGR